jgi:hypothetical protein
MYASRLRIAALAAVAAAGLAACTTPYGYGGVSVGSGYYGSNYGYGGGYPGYGYDSGYGYGYGGGYPGYGYGYDAGYPGYGLGYAPYWGWNDNFYYPGTGYYVYDTYRRPHRWTDAQRRYWSQRVERAQASTSGSQRVVIRENWNDFSRTRPAVRPNRVYQSDNQTVRIDRGSAPVTVERIRPDRVERNIVRSERASEASVRPERVERSVVRSEAQDNRTTVREQRRSAAREERVSRSNGRTKDRDD